MMQGLGQKSDNASAGAEALKDMVAEPLARLIDAHQVWLDCAHRLVEQELTRIEPAAAGPIGQNRSSRLRVHTLLARAEYERSVGGFRKLCKKIEMIHGPTASSWCREMIDILEPPRGWLHLVEDSPIVPTAQASGGTSG